MRNFLIGMMITLLVMLTACGKDESTLLTDGLWNFEDMRTDSDISAIISLVSLSEALLSGATLEFMEDGSYILSSALVEDPIIGEWDLIDDDQLILEPDGELSSTSTIETLTRDRLSYSEDFVNAELISYTVTTTWIRD